MRIDGEKITEINEETIIIPRKSKNIVFKARAVLDMSPVEKLCPPPTPKKKLVRGKGMIEDVEDPHYKKKVQDHGTKRLIYMILKSLEATPNLEWEKVNMSDPNTWENYEEEFREAGFSDIEINRIIKGVMAANCLDEQALEQARNDFLASQQYQEEEQVLSSQKEEKNSIPFGELANA